MARRHNLNSLHLEMIYCGKLPIRPDIINQKLRLGHRRCEELSRGWNCSLKLFCWPRHLLLRMFSLRGGNVKKLPTLPLLRRPRKKRRGTTEQTRECQVDLLGTI